MRNAYESKEEYSPDGKRLVRRERNIGGSVVVVSALLLTVLVLALMGQATLAPISLGGGGVFEGLRLTR
jgi:hypothetical protein